MTFLGWAQIALFCLLVVALARPLGGYMTRLLAGERNDPVARAGADRARLLPCGRRRRRGEQHWVTYGLAMLVFNGLGVLLLYGLQRLQAVLPLNPQGLAAVGPDLAFNTAVSFVTNTNWQSYGGESTMGYLVQMAGADRAELRLGRHRHRALRGVGAGIYAGGCRHHRQFLGRHQPHHALPAAAGLDHLRAVPGLPGRAAEPGPLRHRDDGGGWPAGDRPGPGGLAGGDQDAGHQRWRLLQRQLGASL